MRWYAAASVAALILSGSTGRAQVMPDLVSRTTLRVCADPSNLPFSNRKKEGFENKIADIVGDALHEPVRYLWAPSGPGFIRNTLASDLCDVVMGYTVGSEIVQSTNPYYRSTYVIVAPAGSPLVGVESLDDPKLKGHHLGAFAATPPIDVLLKNGLIDHVKVYPLLVDHRFDSPLATMVGDIEAGRIDAAIVWGPLVGWDVKTSDGKLVSTPLLKDVDRPGFAYRIAFGIRHDEPDWKHKLEGIIRSRKTDINKVLVDYGVPLIDDAGHLITPQAATTASAPAIAPASRAASSRAPDEGKPTPPGFKMPGPAPTKQ